MWIDHKKLYDFDTLEFVAPETKWKIETKNALAYLRVSSTGQLTEGDGIQSQYKACVEAQSSLWVNIVSTFKDEAISGKVIDRPWFLEALSHLDMVNKSSWPQNIKYFMCTEISRISRPEFLDEWLMLCRMIWEKWVVIYDVFSKDFYERWDDMKIIQLMFKLYAAKQERENGANRARNGMRQRLLDWHNPFSKPPAWYKNKKVSTWLNKRNAIAVRDEPYATILQNAFIKYSTGELYNNKEFTEYLAKNNFKTNSQSTPGKKLYSSLFGRLTTPRKLYFYAWYIVYPKRWITEPIPWKHERLFSDIVLKNILYRLKYAKEKRPLITITNSKEEFPLRSILKCKECHRSMYGSFAKWKKIKYPYYECKNENCGLRVKKISRSCRRDVVHSSIEKLLHAFEWNGQLQHLITKFSHEIVQTRNDIHKTEIYSIKKEIAKLENDKSRYEIKFIDPDFENPELQESLKVKWKKCKKNIKKAKIKLFELEAKENTYEHLPAIRETIRKPLTIWKNGDADTKQLLLKVMFNWILEYQKNEGLGTPHFGLPLRESAISNGDISSMWTNRVQLRTHFVNRYDAHYESLIALMHKIQKK